MRENVTYPHYFAQCRVRVEYRVFNPEDGPGGLVYRTDLVGEDGTFFFKDMMLVVRLVVAAEQVMGPLTPQQRDKARRLDEILAIGVHVQDISLVNLDRPIFDRRLSCPTFARQWEGDAWAWVLPGQRVGIRYGRALVTVEDVTHQPAVPIGQKLPEYPHP